MADIDRIDERIAHQAADQADHAVGGEHARGRVFVARGLGAFDVIHGLDQIVDAERNRGHRMMPRNSKPENTSPIAGMGTEKPKFANASPRPLRLRPPRPSPNRFDPHAISMPTAIATRPAGILRGYFTPPNQLTRMIAKQTSPICGVMYISSAGRIEMKVTETPASVPSSAARGVILRINGAMKPSIMRRKLWKNTQTRPADQPLIG